MRAVFLISALLAACGGGRKGGGATQSTADRGVAEKPPRESLFPCQDGVSFLAEGRDAICPCRVPEEGASCCSGSDAWCGATSSSCQYDRCAAAGEMVVTGCSRGVWTVKRTPCRPCPRSDCRADQLCVTRSSREGEVSECVDDPCGGARPLSCRGCAAQACGPGAMCASELTGGTHVVCLVPHS